jgi:hypothetical protein
MCSAHALVHPYGVGQPVFIVILVSIGNPIGETWAFIWFGAIVEVALLATVVRLAWRWRAGRA